MSSALGTPSKKFSWLKKMEAKIEKSLKNSDQEQTSGAKVLTKNGADTASKSE
jgi:hypothetical protein